MSDRDVITYLLNRRGISNEGDEIDGIISLPPGPGNLIIYRFNKDGNLYDLMKDD